MTRFYCIGETGIQKFKELDSVVVNWDCTCSFDPLAGNVDNDVLTVKMMLCRYRYVQVGMNPGVLFNRIFLDHGGL